MVYQEERWISKQGFQRVSRVPDPLKRFRGFRSCYSLKLISFLRSLRRLIGPRNLVKPHETAQQAVKRSINPAEAHRIASKTSERLLTVLLKSPEISLKLLETSLKRNPFKHPETPLKPLQTFVKHPENSLKRDLSRNSTNASESPETPL